MDDDRRRCYECEKRVDFLFHDSRCMDCTRMYQDPDTGEGRYEQDDEVIDEDN